ncbi:MAG: hypothetical protein IJ228_00340 [Succinivibrio sp.]|nr:hypothetical protein [Succinivibrio sp.]
MPIQLTDEQYQKMYRREGFLEGYKEVYEEAVHEGERQLQKLIQAMIKAGRTLESIYSEITESPKLHALYKQYGVTD